MIHGKQDSVCQTDFNACEFMNRYQMLDSKYLFFIAISTFDG